MSHNSRFADSRLRESRLNGLFAGGGSLTPGRRGAKTPSVHTSDVRCIGDGPGAAGRPDFGESGAGDGSDRAAVFDGQGSAS